MSTEDTPMTSSIAMTTSSSTHIDPEIFHSLQSKIDSESLIRDELRLLIDHLSKQSRLTQSIISRIHNTPTASLASNVLQPGNASIDEQVETVKKLAETASKYPFYKWNSMWSREVQGLVSAVQIIEWLSSTSSSAGGATNGDGSGGEGKLISLEEIGARLNVPVNLKNEDKFHITIEDYLLALTVTLEELARLAPNAVTLGDYARPLQISRFIKDVHAGFQLLNLKNDALRRRSDGIKYSVKKVEDVVYDLSLRGLVPKA